MYQILMPDMLSATPDVGAGPLSNTARRDVTSETAFCMWQGDLFSLPCPVWRRELLTAMACPKDEDFRLDVKHETKRRFRQLWPETCKESVSPSSMDTLQTDRRQPAMRFTAMSVAAFSALHCAVLVSHVAAQSVTDDVCQTCCFSDGVKPALRKNLDGKQWKTVICWYKWGNYSNEISMNISQSYWKAITIITSYKFTVINDLTDFQAKKDVKTPDLHCNDRCSKKQTWKELEQCCFLPSWPGAPRINLPFVFTWLPYRVVVFSIFRFGSSDRGLWMNGLKAGEATTAAARILIEEMLGFHTVTSQSAGDSEKLLTGWQLRMPMSS